MMSPTYDACLVEAELRARAAYADPGRHYHNERHLDECLEKLADVPGLAERERRLLKWAILWHDAIYEPGSSDNEQRSAELARRELAGCGVPEADAEEVARLIELTRGHDAAQNDRLGVLMVSIDLAILGSGPARYRTYADDVRREHPHISDEDWRIGRAAMVKALLAREPLYPDPEFRTALEHGARRNMAEELSRLAEG